MASWNIFNRGDDKDKEKQLRNSERIQDFINKFHIPSRDLDTSQFDKNDKNPDSGWQGYSWIQKAVSTSKNRYNRYKEYREMTRIPELEQSLSIYADNSTQYNIQKNVIEIQSDNNKIIEVLEKLFFDVLDINANLWHYTRNMCKLGDEFLEVSVDSPERPKSIISLERIKKPENMSRIEKDGNLLRFEYNINEDEISNLSSGSEDEAILFQPWQVIHFRIEDEEFHPYGKSVFEAGRALWKKLALMEDAMLIYRISRAPERRVFYIDVGTLSTKEANKFIEQVKRQFRKKKFVNPTTGEIDEKANPLSTDEDFFLPVRQNSTGTRIETLPGGQNLGEIDDVKYFKDGILRTLGVPIGYLGGASEGGVGYDPKSYLSNQEIQFSRTIERIQKLVVKGLEKIAIIQLALHKISDKEIRDFKIKLTPPSNVDQLMDVEIRNQQFALIQSIRALISNEGIPFLPDEWIYKNVLEMSDQDINKIRLQIQMQMQMNGQLQQMFAPTEGGAGGALGGGGMETVGGDMGGVAGGVAGGPEEAPAPGGEEVGAGAEESPGLEIASQNVEFDGGKWLLENGKDFKKLIDYIKLYEKVHKDNNGKKLYEHKNSLTRMAIHGEFRGLLKAYKSSNTRFKTLNEINTHKKTRKKKIPVKE